MTEENQPHADNKEKTEVNKYASILFQSFKHSQGSPELQHLILEYYRRSEKIKSGFTPSVMAGVIENVEQRTLRMAPSTHPGDTRVGHDRIGEDDVKTQALLQAEAMNSIFSLKMNVEILGTPMKLSQVEDDTLVAEILRVMLIRDHEYLVVKKGRPNRPEGTPESTLIKDKHFSFLYSYAINGMKTGVDAFDHMYEEVKGHIDNDKNNTTLKEIISAYKLHHPNS